MMFNRRQILALSVTAIVLGLTNCGHAELVAQWKFDNDVSPQPDASGNGHDAVPQDDAIWVSDAVRGGVMEFDGGGDHLLVGDSDLLSIEGDLTITAWANFTSFDNWNSIVGKTGSVQTHTPAPYDLYTSQVGQVPVGTPQFLLGNGIDAAGVKGTASPVAGTWEHVAVTATHDGAGNINIVHYLNGELNGEGSITVAQMDNDTDLFIGSRADGRTNMFGRLDDVRIYNQALSQDEIRAIVPEPSGVVLIIIGLLGIAGRLTQTHNSAKNCA